VYHRGAAIDRGKRTRRTALGDRMRREDDVWWRCAMDATRERFYRKVFLVAAVYDVGLGIVFVFFHKWVFDWLDIEREVPESNAVALLGAFLFVIGVAYYLIYRGDLWRNRDLIAVGALYKLAYSAIVFWFAALGDVPHWTFVGLFGVADLIFLALMVACLLWLHRLHPSETRPPIAV
jgi:hypothetical protein